MLCLLKMGPYLWELMKCLSNNLRNILPTGIIVLREKVGGKANGISVEPSSGVVGFLYVGDAVPKSASS